MIRILAGVALGLLGIGFLWFGGLVAPPEALSRWVAAFTAVFPASVSEAVVERIPCSPLERLRLYVVCTGECTDLWKIVSVKGLRSRTIANLGRVPPEPEGDARRRFNAAVGREALQLDPQGARDMIGCYLLLDGLHPELVLPHGGRRAVEEARGSEGAMRQLAESLDTPGAVSRIPVTKTREGYVARFLYWDTKLPGRPIREIHFRLARGGQLQSVRAEVVPVSADTASGNTPETPPF